METSYDEIRKSLGLASPTHISQACSTLEKYEIIKKIKDGGIVKVDFNIEGINEIVKLSSQRKSSEKLIDELFGGGKWKMIKKMKSDTTQCSQESEDTFKYHQCV